MASIISTGIGSGLNIGSIVEQLVEAERAPAENRLNSKAYLAESKVSAFGALKSALENFQSKLETLQDPETFSGRKVSVESDAGFTATADTQAAAGSHEVSVEQLASRHKIASAGYTDAQTSVGTGQLTITVNGESFSLDVLTGEDSLESIRNAINEADDNVGVTASIVTDQDGARLVLTSDESGADNAIAVSVVFGILRAAVARITEAILVRVRLVGVRRRRTVVDVTAVAVTVQIRCGTVTASICG